MKKKFEEVALAPQRDNLQLGWTITRCGDVLGVVRSGHPERQKSGTGATYCHSGATILRRTISQYAKYGAEGQNRTVDTSLFRAVLYQLSYLGISVGCMEGVSVYRITEEKSTLDVRRGGEGGI